jgi:large subunit ribosomal protein L18e
MRRTITNPELQEAIRFLKVKAKENKATIWEVAAEHLSRPRRARTALNVSHIERETAKDSPVLVPGKVLSGGMITHPVVVGAFKFSKDAKAKIERAGGKCVGIKDFVSLYPKGSKVKILR